MEMMLKTEPQRYRTRVEITDTGMVVASVFAPDRRRVGLRFFSPIIATTKATSRKAQRAHAWAEKHAAMCARMESPMAGNNQQPETH